MSQAMRCTSTRVLPLPAPASTRVGRASAETASRWAGLSLSRMPVTSMRAFYPRARRHTLYWCAETTETRMRVFNSFILWLILLILCWPLALLALILYPFIWLLLLPFRLIGITVDAVFELLRTILFL